MEDNLNKNIFRKSILFVFFTIAFVTLLVDFYFFIKDRALLAFDVGVLITGEVQNTQVIGITRNEDRIEFDAVESSNFNLPISYYSKDKYFKAIEIKNFKSITNLSLVLGEQIKQLNLNELTANDSNSLIIEGNSKSLVPIFKDLINYKGDFELALQLIFLAFKILLLALIFLIIDLVLDITYHLLPSF
jgi:hypothetical protein